MCPWTPGAPLVQTTIKCSFVIWIESSLPTGARLLGPKQKCAIFMALCFDAIRKMARLRFNSFLLLLQWLKNQIRRRTRPHLSSVTQQSSWGYQDFFSPSSCAPLALIGSALHGAFTWVWRTQVKVEWCHAVAHLAAATRHKLRGR